MAEKTLNTRIALKYDTYENWKTHNPVLKAGEVAIATIPSNQDGVQNAPSILMKVGDGTSKYNALKFVSGLSADVHDWAKAATKPTYAASEITGLEAFIAGEIQDTDTQYRITKVDDYNYKLQSKAKGEADTAFADVSTIVIPKYDDTTVTADIDALKTKVGDKTVSQQIDAKITSNLNNGTIAKGEDLTTLSGKVTTLIGTTEGDDTKSARTIASEEVAKIVAGADTAYDTLKEIADWITTHKSDATAMNTAITALENKLSGIAAGEGTVKKYVDDAITALKIGDYAKAADLTALAGRVSDLEGDTHTHANKTVLDGITSTKVAAWDKVSEKANDADLAAIAKSGNVNDLVQTSGDVLVLDCGDSNC